MHKKIFLLLALFLSVPQKGFAQTEFNWSSLTWDNDAFLGNDDDGYTNGMYIALYQLKEYEQPSNAPWLLRPLMWSLTEKADVGLNAYTIGQAMITPQNTETETPAEDDLPYSGLLFLNNSYLSIHQNYTDKISTTIGVVGPLSLAEESQKTIHKWIGSGEPKGWDTQLKNELVFQLSRARAYRSWVADNNCWDLITAGEVSIGTLSSGVNVDVVLRFGTALKYSYATQLLNSTRTTNPTVIGGGGYVYAGISAGYLFNQIFTDGNTFTDSRSVDYDHEKISAMLGVAYSWGSYSISLAAYDASILTNKSEKQAGLTQYGTFTFSFGL